MLWECLESVVVILCENWDMVLLCCGVAGNTRHNNSAMGEGGSCSSWAPWLVHTAVAVSAITIATAANHYWFHARSKGRPRVVGIIPARYMSSRFEGKPLVHIMGKPMIQVLHFFDPSEAIGCSI